MHYIHTVHIIHVLGTYRGPVIIVSTRYCKSPALSALGSIVQRGV